MGTSLYREDSHTIFICPECRKITKANISISVELDNDLTIHTSGDNRLSFNFICPKCKTRTIECDESMKSIMNALFDKGYKDIFYCFNGGYEKKFTETQSDITGDFFNDLKIVIDIDSSINHSADKMTSEYKITEEEHNNMMEVIKYICEEIKPIAYTDWFKSANKDSDLRRTISNFIHYVIYTATSSSFDDDKYSKVKDKWVLCILRNYSGCDFIFNDSSFLIECGSHDDDRIELTENYIKDCLPDLTSLTNIINFYNKGMKMTREGYSK